MRKLGATKVEVTDYGSGPSVEVEFGAPDCKKEHFSSYDEEVSEEEWQKRHLWYNEFGERGIAEARKYIESGEYAHDNRPFDRESLYDRSQRMQDDADMPPAPAGMPTPANPEPDSDQFQDWFASNPNPAHFNR